jgi:hypothetical protein
MESAQRPFQPVPQALLVQGSFKRQRNIGAHVKSAAGRAKCQANSAWQCGVSQQGKLQFRHTPECRLGAACELKETLYKPGFHLKHCSIPHIRNPMPRIFLAEIICTLVQHAKSRLGNLIEPHNG